MEILLALLKGPKHVRELQEEVGGSALTVEMRIQEFLKEGYIEEEQWKSWPFRKILRLTDQGRRVASLMKLGSGYLALRKISAEKAKERGKWLLCLLQAMGGVVEGATRLQKLLFLLKHEFGIREVTYEFFPFLHGPFSDEINDDALDLEIAGLVHVEREVVEPTLYALTPQGTQAAKEIFDRLPEETKEALLKVRKFNGMKLVELLKYVYSKYREESKIVG